MQRRHITLASILLMTAVLAGAFGAHGLRDNLNERQMASWHTAVSYQFYHGLAILVLATLGDLLPHKLLRTVGHLFLAGIICFSGSLYILTISDITQSISTKILGPVTPVGGLFFLAGWVLLIYGSVVEKPVAGR